MRLRYNFSIAGYVVMPEHVHLLLSEPEQALLSKALQALKLSVSVQSEQRPFWQKRYFDFNVYTDDKRKEKLRYIHRNPVTRGLVQAPEQWLWSSFRHWLTGEPGIVGIESVWTGGGNWDPLNPRLKSETWGTRHLGDSVIWVTPSFG